MSLVPELSGFLEKKAKRKNDRCYFILYRHRLYMFSKEPAADANWDRKSKASLLLTARSQVRKTPAETAADLATLGLTVEADGQCWDLIVPTADEYYQWMGALQKACADEQVEPATPTPTPQQSQYGAAPSLAGGQYGAAPSLAGGQYGAAPRLAGAGGDGGGSQYGAAPKLLAQGQYGAAPGMGVSEPQSQYQSVSIDETDHEAAMGQGAATAAVTAGAPPDHFTDGVDDLTKYAWFHGQLARPDAEQCIRGKPQGSYLVRNASDLAGFVVTWLDCGTPRHIKIARVQGEEGVRYRSGSSLYDGINEAVMDLKDNGALVACVPSQHAEVQDQDLKAYRMQNNIFPVGS